MLEVNQVRSDTDLRNLVRHPGCLPRDDLVVGVVEVALEMEVS